MLHYHMCLQNLCKIWPKQKFCFRGMGAFLFYFCWFYPGINDTCENERRRAEEAPVGICCPPLASQMPKNTDGLYDCYGLETHSMRSNLSSYREGKKKKRKSIWMWVCSQHETVWINNGNGPVTKESAGASSRCQGRISSPSWPLEGGKNNRL